ncbi:MAG: response regulator [Pseudomonadota bacterium]
MWFFNPSILIIDDDESICSYLSMILNKNNYQIDIAHNGINGVNRAIEKKHDLIILDWVMPKMNGLEVLAKLRSDQRTRNIPIIMLTGENLIGEIEDAFKAGVNAYLTKPIVPKKLYKKVNELI